jgi:hypothetical protein
MQIKAHCKEPLIGLGASQDRAEDAEKRRIIEAIVHLSSVLERMMVGKSKLAL